MFFLKVNKLKTKRVGELEAQMLNLEKTVMDLRTQEDNLAVFRAMKQGSAQLKRMQEEMPAEKVRQLMDDNAESAAYMKEISAMLGGELDEEEDQDVLAEYAALERLDADETMATVPTVPTDEVPTKVSTKDDTVVLPDVPTEEPAVATKPVKVREEVRVAVPA